MRLPTSLNIKFSKKRKDVVNENTTNIDLIKSLADSLDIGDIANVNNSEISIETLTNLFIAYPKLHEKYITTKFQFEYYKTLDELDSKNIDYNFHLSQNEDIKEKLLEAHAILMQDNQGTVILGLFTPQFNIDVDFEKIAFIGTNVFNTYYGKGKELKFNSSSSSVSLKDLLQYLETRKINDLGIDPINEHQFNISAEISKQNVNLNERPILKDVIDSVFHEALLETGKDTTTDFPTGTGKIKKRLVDFKGSPIERTFRLNFLNVENGKSLSIRRFMTYNEINQLGFTGLNFKPKTVALIEKALYRKLGACFFTGGTNTGKSTTLAVVLNKLHKENNKVISIENPIEIQMPYNQIDLSKTETADERFKMTKEKAQAGMLRHNPNVVLISEVRFADEINFAIGLGLSGHFFFTTMHTDSVETTIERLLRNSDESELKSILNIIVCLKQLPMSCPTCEGKGVLENNSLCIRCDGKGLTGSVVPLAEVALFNKLEPSDSLKDLNKLYKEGKIEYLSFEDTAKELLDEKLITKSSFDWVVESTKPLTY